MKPTTTLRSFFGVVSAIIATVFFTVACADTSNSPTKDISQSEVLALMASGAPEQHVIIDVRTPEEYRAGHVPHAVNIPHDAILNDISLLDAHKDKTMVLYCRSGGRVGRVMRLLDSLEYPNVKHLDGDMMGWERAQQPIERPAQP